MIYPSLGGASRPCAVLALAMTLLYRSESGSGRARWIRRDSRGPRAPTVPYRARLTSPAADGARSRPQSSTQSSALGQSTT
jgi:hypothetical protein